MTYSAIPGVSQGTKNRLIGLTFGLGGLVSSLVFLKIVPTPLHPVRPGGPLLLLIPGGCLVAAMTVSYLICWSLGLIGQIRFRAWRFFSSTILVSLMGIVGTFGGFFVGVSIALLNAQPIHNGRVVPSSHPLFHLVFPVIVGCMGAAFLTGVMLCLALYALTKRWDKRLWVLTLLLSLALVGVTISAQPGFFDLRRMLTGENIDDVFNQIVRSLFIWGSIIYGVCTGYWLTRNGEFRTARSIS